MSTTRGRRAAVTLTKKQLYNQGAKSSFNICVIPPSTVTWCVIRGFRAFSSSQEDFEMYPDIGKILKC